MGKSKRAASVSGERQVVGCGENGNKPTGFYKMWEFLD